MAALALAVRLVAFPHESTDYRHYVLPWYRYIADHGFAGSLGDEFSNYAPPYLYLLGLLTFLPVRALVAIKALSVAFDFALAGAAVVLIRSFPLPRWRALAAWAAVLLCPTVVMNSAFWAQCDALFATFVVLSVAAAVRGRAGWAALALGAGFAVKAQAAFVFPLLLLLVIRRKASPLSLLLVPVPYLVSIVPTWIAGRPLWDLLSIYWDQSQDYGQETLNAPNLYQWLPHQPWLSDYGVLFAAGPVAVILALCWWRKLACRRDELLLLALTFSLLAPFFLPRMHDRYFYVADILVIVYAFVVPRRAFLPLLVVSASLVSYAPFLFEREPVPLEYAAVLDALAIATCLYDLARALRLVPRRPGRFKDVLAPAPSGTGPENAAGG